jgi:hypothetical protein
MPKYNFRLFRCSFKIIDCSTRGRELNALPTVLCCHWIMNVNLNLMMPLHGKCGICSYVKTGGLNLIFDILILFYT